MAPRLRDQKTPRGRRRRALEQKVPALRAQGKTQKEIAAELGISLNTAEWIMRETLQRDEYGDLLPKPQDALKWHKAMTMHAAGFMVMEISRATGIGLLATAGISLRYLRWASAMRRTLSGIWRTWATRSRV